MSSARVFNGDGQGVWLHKCVREKEEEKKDEGEICVVRRRVWFEREYHCVPTGQTKKWLVRRLLLLLLRDKKESLLYYDYTPSIYAMQLGESS
jgi:hypothetical protein